MTLSIDSVEERERFLARVSGLESGEQRALIEKNSEKEFEERERFLTRVQGLDSEEQRALIEKISEKEFEKRERFLARVSRLDSKEEKALIARLNARKAMVENVKTAPELRQKLLRSLQSIFENLKRKI